MLIDKRTNVLLLMLDPSAAFDTINDEKLLKKLECLYGINKGGSIQEARHKTVDFPVDFPRRKNRGISRGISTESSTETKPWNFHRKFHRIKAVELPVEFPLNQNRGISRGNSTESSQRQNRGTFCFNCLNKLIDSKV